MIADSLDKSPARIVFLSSRVLTPEGLRPAAVVVEAGRIIAVNAPDQIPPDAEVINVNDRVLMPGLVDTHVHVNEPGHTDWEGFDSATRAAAAGGVTTIVDMPLNSLPVTTSVAALEEKRRAARGQMWVDCGFYGGIVPENTSNILALADEGVLGFKAFLCPSGLDEFPATTEDDLREAMLLIREAGAPLLVHAEIVGPIPIEATRALARNPTNYRAYAASRPVDWEVDAVRMVTALASSTKCRAHFVHLSSARGLAVLRIARHKGMPVSAETCSHYLSFAADEIRDGANEFKCAPPIRRRSDREALWEGLRDGTLSTVGSDHSPSPPKMKRGDLPSVWGGIAGLQTTLSTVWMGASQRNVPFPQVMSWLTAKPAELVGLAGRKGVIAPGADADFVVFDPDSFWTIDQLSLWYRHKSTPFHGRRCRGIVEQTYLRGRLVFDRDRFVGEPSGQVLTHAERVTA